jgi:hypothetical protein
VTSADFLKTNGVSQDFASKGATYLGGDRGSPKLADSDQLKLSYNAASNTYEIQLPGSNQSLGIAPIAGEAGSWSTADSTTTVSAQSADYATLVFWSSTNSFGVTAIAIPTPASAIPTTGSADYAGTVAGNTTEGIPFGDTQIPGRISGTIDLSFDFASGQLAGAMSPVLSGRGFPTFALPTLTFKDTLYSVGSTTFSGKFDTNVPGLNSFSGLFAGPNANNVAGNFAFPYLSPRNGISQQASGAFVAGRSP